MFQQLRLRHFKSWRELDIVFGEITGLFGTNSSGKSSIIQFLLMLKQTREERDRATVLQLNGPYVSLGQFSDVITQGDDALHLEWTLSFKREKALTLIDATGSSDSITASSDTFHLSSEVAAEQLRAGHASRMWSTFLEYSLSGVSFRLRTDDDNKSDYELISAGGKFEFLRIRGRPWKLPGPVQSYAFPDQARTYFQNAQLLSDLEAAYENELDHLYYLGPLRAAALRDYVWTGSRPIDVGNSGEKTIEALVSATVAGTLRNLGPRKRMMPFQEVVAYWLKHLDLIEDFSLTELYPSSNRWIARVSVTKQSRAVPLSDVGTGVAQVLPVITLLQYVPEGSTVMLEQPELHLHPLAQANLADVIIQAATHRHVQIILESHSEHLVLRLQRRIAERALTSEKVRLYFASMGRDRSTLTTLELDDEGNIRNWPEKFLGDPFAEVAKAELTRIDFRRGAGSNA